MRTTRRQFCAGLLALPAAAAKSAELACDIAILGGSVGGCAAALARRTERHARGADRGDADGSAASSPARRFRPMSTSGSSSSARPGPTGSTAQAVRDYYRRNYPLTEAARARWNLNPGDGGVSRLTHEPRVSLAVLEEMLAPYVSAGRVVVLTGYKPVAADVDGDRIRSVTVEGGSAPRGARTVFSGRDRAGRPSAAGEGGIYGGRGIATADGRTACARAGEPGKHSIVHLLFRRRLSTGRGSHHRPARRIRVLARLRPKAHASVVGQAAELADPRIR